MHLNFVPTLYNRTHSCLFAECYSPSLADCFLTLGNLHSSFGPAPKGDIVQMQALNMNFEIAAQICYCPKSWQANFEGFLTPKKQPLILVTAEVCPLSTSGTPGSKSSALISLEKVYLKGNQCGDCTRVSTAAARPGNHGRADLEEH